MAAEDYEAALFAAERAFQQAQTAEEVRAAWRAYFATLGHRTLGRLLLGRTAKELLERRTRSAERD